MKLAPIILFTFDRLSCLEQTVEALKNNYYAKDSVLYIYSDNFKISESSSKKNVLKVRSYLKSITGFLEIKIIEREINFGLARNIIEGVTETLKKHNSAIILEDDLLTGKYFLDYMNKGLTLYKKNEDVISIHGYSYFENSPYEETYFIKTADNLGWATWKRGWELFESDADFLYKKIIENNLQRSFNRNNAYKFSNLLKMQAENKLNSWAIRWYASAFLNQKYTLYPYKSLVLHIGDGPEATNYKRKQTKSDPLSVNLYQGQINLKKIDIIESETTSKNYIKHLKKYRRSILKRFFSKLISIIN